MNQRLSLVVTNTDASQQGKPKTFFELVEELKKPDIDPSADLKELYYQESANKQES